MDENAFERLQNKRFFRFFDWLTRLIFVNLCMILLSLCGLVVLGAFPAMFAAAAYFNDVFEGKEGKMLPSMFGYFRQYFLTGNLLMLLFVPALALGLYTIYGPELNTLVCLVIYCWLILAFALLWYLPPVSILYPEFKTKKKLIFALVVSANRWAMTLLFLAAGLAWLYAVLLMPQLLMFLMFSGPVWFGMWRIKKTLKPESFYDPLREESAVQ